MSFACTVTLRSGKVTHHYTVKSFLLTKRILGPKSACHHDHMIGSNSREIGKLRFPRSRVQPKANVWQVP